METTDDSPPQSRTLGAAVVVRSRASEFARLAPEQRVSLLRSVMVRTAAVATDWVREACTRKSIAFDSPVSGEEWLGGPAVVVRNCRLLAESWGRIAQGQLPHQHLKMRGDGDTVKIDVFPASGFDAALFAGFRCTVTARRLDPQSGPFLPDGGRTCLVLGAGNVSSIPAMDVLHKMFVEGRTCVLKMNPVNAYVGPFIEKAFAPLISRGYLKVVYGGADIGKALCEHVCIDEIHITGSEETHDLIVWGPKGPERERRKRANDPVCRKPVTSELGNVSPVIIVPGEYREHELLFMARNVATMVANNASFNCNAAKMLVTCAGWKQREAFLDAVHLALMGTPLRVPYYPGARDRYQKLLEGRDADYIGTPADRSGEALQWAMVCGLNPADRSDPLFRTEPFCGILSETALPASDLGTFVHEAVRFCNETLWGTLNASLMIDPRTEKTREGLGALLGAIDHLAYGTVAVNHWPALGYGFVSPPWGGAPGATPADVRSGIGWVHNTFMLRGVIKSVVRGPLTVAPVPAWFCGNRMTHVIGQKMTSFEQAPSWLKVPGIAAAALRG